MILEWWTQSFKGVAASQSTHHPLQRMMVGLTCPSEWHWMIRMIQEWWTEGGMMSTVIPRSSVKSVHPSSSAEDDGWTDLFFGWYWMIRMISKWWSQFGMMDSVIPEWLRNDGMRMKCLCLKLSSQPKPVKIGASYWSRAQNRGLWLVERTPKKI